MLPEPGLLTAVALLVILGALGWSGDSKVSLLNPPSLPEAEPASAPAAIAMVSGEVQDSRPDEWLPDPFVVRVSDPAGHGVSGVTVTWRVVRGWGELSASSSETDGAGRAATFFRGWGEEGVYAVEARAPGLSGSPVTFSVGGVTADGPNE